MCLKHHGYLYYSTNISVCARSICHALCLGHRLTVYSVTDTVVYILQDKHVHTHILIYTHTEAVQCKETLPVFAPWQLATSLFPVNWELATSQLLIRIIKILFQLNHDIRFISNVKNDLIQVGNKLWICDTYFKHA